MGLWYHHQPEVLHSLTVQIHYLAEYTLNFKLGRTFISLPPWLKIAFRMGRKRTQLAPDQRAFALEATMLRLASP